LVQRNHFGGYRCASPIGARLPGVFQHREEKLVLTGVFRNIFQGFVGVGVDADKLHAALTA